MLWLMVEVRSRRFARWFPDRLQSEDEGWTGASIGHAMQPLSNANLTDHCAPYGPTAAKPHHLLDARCKRGVTSCRRASTLLRITLLALVDYGDHGVPQCLSEIGLVRLQMSTAGLDCINE